MTVVTVILLHILMVASISLSAPQAPLDKELSRNLTAPELQPPPVTYTQQQPDGFPSTRRKRCGGGGGCYQPAPSKTYHISIKVQKAPAPRPRPVMQHPVAVAVVPVAVVPVTYARPASYCCSGGGGGGGYGGGKGGKKWHKGK